MEPFLSQDTGRYPVIVGISVDKSQVALLAYYIAPHSYLHYVGRRSRFRLSLAFSERCKPKIVRIY